MKPARCKALFQPRQVVNSYSAPQRYAASGTARACRDDAVRLAVGRPFGCFSRATSASDGEIGKLIARHQDATHTIGAASKAEPT